MSSWRPRVFFFLKNGEKITDVVLLASLILFAYWISFQSGTRGFFPFDQSVPFDGGFRIFSGQVPFKDFLSPFPPLIYYLQALFFALFGVNYGAYVAAAAVQNVLAAGCSVMILRRLFPEGRFLSLSAGFVTAAWFYPPCGTPNFEQTGFLFLFLGLYFWIDAILLPSGRRKMACAALSGLCVILAFLSKQNVGAMGALLFAALGAAALWPRWKEFLKIGSGMAAGMVLGSAVFAAWLFLASDPANFFRYCIEIPMRLGSHRLEIFSDARLIENLTHGFWPEPKWISIPPLIKQVPLPLRLVILFIYGLCWARLVSGFRDTRVRLAAFLGVALVHFQYLFIGITSNTYLNGLAFLGILLGIGFGLAGELQGSAETPGAGLPGSFSVMARRSLLSGLVVSAAATTLWGTAVSLRRDVQDLFFGSRFDQAMAADRWKPLKWGNPTTMEDHSQRDPVTGQCIGFREISRDSVDELQKFLSAKGVPFFIFPDFGVFYGMTGIPSRQPLLLFFRGKSYPEQYDPKLDERVVSALDRQSVETIVLEEISFFGTAERLRDFPMLEEYIARGFKKTSQIGIFQVYEKIPAAG